MFCLGRRSKLFWCKCGFVFAFTGCRLDEWEELLEYISFKCLLVWDSNLFILFLGYHFTIIMLALSSSTTFSI